MQAQMLQTIKQTMVNLHAQPQAPLPLRDGTQLSRYASLQVDADEKKQDYFLNGLTYALEA
jgi:hypothetical protein